MTPQKRKCHGIGCQRPVKFRVLYDCGRSGDQELILCADHYTSDDSFQRNIRSIEELKE